MATSNGTLVEIELPCRASAADLSQLQRCEGRVLFLPTVRARVPLRDVDYRSYCVGGVEPDTLALLAAFKHRFPAVITRVLPGRVCAVVLGVSQIPAGLALQNTGPFDLCNGDAVCFLPPMFEGACGRLRLDSIDADLVFPLTVPAPVARETMAKTLARAAEAVGAGTVGPLRTFAALAASPAPYGANAGCSSSCSSSCAPPCAQTGGSSPCPGEGPSSSSTAALGHQQHQPQCARLGGPARDADVVTYNGRRHVLTPVLRRLDAAEASVRTLLLNMIFAVNEGNMLLYALVPSLLSLGAADGYVNALVGLGSATRAAGQLIRMPDPPNYQDANRRFPLYEALASWIQMATHLGEQLSVRPLLRVCAFDGPSTVKAGETAPVISNWF